jgi:hypothetical protein
MLTQGALPGPFLFRSSDRCAGQFVVVYVTSSPNKKGDGGAGGGDDREVKHYLINPEDIEKKSTLPDFLRDCENLWFLLQVVRDHDTGVVRHHTTHDTTHTAELCGLALTASVAGEPEAQEQGRTAGLLLLAGKVADAAARL